MTLGLVLAGCGSGSSADTPPAQTPADTTEAGHVHEPSQSWEADRDTHWRTCSCGAGLEEAVHTVQHGRCIVCISDLYYNEDGSARMSRYDEQGRCVLTVIYGKDGQPEQTYEYKVEYTDTGALSSQLYYENGGLLWERYYAADENGQTYIQRAVDHLGDGHYTVTTYDAAGTILDETTYDADGNVAAG